MRTDKTIRIKYKIKRDNRIHQPVRLWQSNCCVSSKYINILKYISKYIGNISNIYPNILTNIEEYRPISRNIDIYRRISKYIEIYRDISKNIEIYRDNKLERSTAPPCQILKLFCQFFSQSFYHNLKLSYKT